eukprot:CAMPEP_0176239034 /NCGR_PEP_ID=MMETSP0121_2-20121125/28667_1 /TAXON_ID=160619 /ORGANISM="Kryptoperidinium foliaceum, Strain CCMP 1326" /LENGTH=46 /DNA_ID= /DNA_START= /DNA_END= /DNA_ORIENTATION=
MSLRRFAAQQSANACSVEASRTSLLGASFAAHALPMCRLSSLTRNA